MNRHLVAVEVGVEGPSRPPYQLSRSHCEIDFENGRFVLRDRGSKLGTFVDGEQVCVDSGKISAELKQGENDIVFAPTAARTTTRSPSRS